MNCAIGVDIGSSAIKAVLYAPEIPEVLKLERRPLISRIPSAIPGRFEEDPNAIRTIIFEVISYLAEFAKKQHHEVEAIAFTGQMHGGLVVDSSFRPLTNFITWQDKRGDESASSGKTFVEELREISPQDPTGAGIHTGFLIATLYWFHRTLSLTRFHRGSGKILGIYDWLTSIFASRAVTDITSAAAWGMFDPISFEWRSDLLEAAAIDRKMLPEVKEPGEKLGTINQTIASELGLDDRVRIHASIGDTQAAYLGSECAESEVLINIGTGSQSLWATTASNPPGSGTDIRYLRGGRYLACAPTLAGGQAYRALCEFFRETVRAFAGIELTSEDTFSTMNRMAEESSSDGLTVDPIFQGSKFRGDLERGSIIGISSENFRPRALARAIAEGMIEEIARPYFANGNKHNHNGLVGAGGAIRRNSALRVAAEKRFGMRMRLGRFGSEAAAGAAMLCG